MRSDKNRAERITVEVTDAVDATISGSFCNVKFDAQVNHASHGGHVLELTDVHDDTCLVPVRNHTLAQF